MEKASRNSVEINKMCVMEKSVNYSIRRLLQYKDIIYNWNSHDEYNTVFWPSYLCKGNPQTLKDHIYIETWLWCLFQF